MANLIPTIAPKSDQLNADDLIGRSITIKITKVGLLADAQPIAIHYEGDDNKPWKPCKSMRRVMVNAWGGDGNAYVGRRLTLFRDPTVKFGGLEVGGIRISHMSDISGPFTMALTKTKANKQPFTVQPIGNAPAAQPAAQPVDEAIVKAGSEAAAKGVAAYVAWRDALSAEDKEKIKPLNPKWSDTAKKADAKALDADAPAV